ncbi:MAG: PD-(D/E)XK nuclease family protein [Erysipelotrichaceae bacterium]
MKLESISSGIIIADASLHASLREQLLAHRDEVCDIQLLDLHSYLSTFYSATQISSNERIFQCYQVLKAQQHRFPYFEKTMLDHAFLTQVLAFIDDMIFYDIQCTDLPSGHIFQIELKEIVTLLLSIPSPLYQLKQAMQQASKQNHADIYILPAYFSPQNKDLVSLLLTHGATMIEVPNYRAEGTLESYVNVSQEIEALAQTCYDTNERIVISAPNSDYKLLMEQCFNRYGLDFAFTKLALPSKFTQYFSLLLAYGFTHDPALELEIVKLNPFLVPHNASLLDFMENFQCTLDDDFSYVTSINFAAPYFSNRDASATLALYERAAKAKTCLVSALDTIKAATQPKDLFNVVNALILEAHYNMSRDQQQTLRKIQRLLIEVAEYVDQDSYPLLLAMLAEITQDTPQQKNARILIKEYHEMILGYDTHFVVGTTQNNYPGFPLKKGIFDEDYYREITYPSMSKRFELHMEQLSFGLCLYPNRKYSFPLSTFDGKSLECALEMERLKSNQTIETKLPQRGFIPTAKLLHIDPALARTLYLNDNQISGSISSIELFAHCPLAYFLRYGLRLREPIQTAFKSNTIGSLIHNVFEHIVSQYGSEYPQIETTHLETIIEEEIQKLRLVYPKKDLEFKLLSKRIVTLFQKNLAALAPFEAQTQLQPTYLEYDIDHTFTLGDGVTLSFRGIVDRINANADRFTIIDYKSSAQRIQLDKFASGAQLQLITYASIVSSLLDKGCVGAFYYNFKPKRVAMDAFKLGRRDKELHDLFQDSIRLDALRKANVFEGAAFKDELSLLEQDETFHKNTGKGEFKKVYDLNYLTACLHELYHTLVTSLLQGDIQARTNDGKCGYCSYQSICRLNIKDTMKLPQRLELDPAQLYLKGGKVKDADME